jgi:hypothetical protein
VVGRPQTVGTEGSCARARCRSARGRATVAGATAVTRKTSQPRRRPRSSSAYPPRAARLTAAAATPGGRPPPPPQPPSGPSPHPTPAAAPLRRLLGQQHLELGAAPVVQDRAVERLHRQRRGRGLVKLDVGDWSGKGDGLGWAARPVGRCRGREGPVTPGDRTLQAPAAACQAAPRAGSGPGMECHALRGSARRPDASGAIAARCLGDPGPPRRSPPLSLMTLTCWTPPYSEKAARSVSSCARGEGGPKIGAGSAPGLPPRGPPGEAHLHGPAAHDEQARQGDGQRVGHGDAGRSRSPVLRACCHVRRVWGPWPAILGMAWRRGDGLLGGLQHCAASVPGLGSGRGAVSRAPEGSWMHEQWPGTRGRGRGGLVWQPGPVAAGQPAAQPPDPPRYRERGDARTSYVLKGRGNAPGAPPTICSASRRARGGLTGSGEGLGE